MTTGKCNIARNVWRFVEVFLFFAVSVFGFNILVKTTSLNTKSKTSSFSQALTAPRELSLPEITLPLHFGIDRLTGFFSVSLHKNSSSITDKSTDHQHADSLYHRYRCLKHYEQNLNEIAYCLPSSLCKPANLLQQNRVLLI